MDLFSLKSLVFSLCFIGPSVGQKIVSESPAQAYLGENTTLKILIENEPSNIITWNFKGGNQILNVALLRPEGVKVNERYKGRASIDSANGHLTLTSAQLNDSGNYTVLVLGENTTEIGIVKLHVVDILHPNLTLLAPSSEELQQKKLTLTCLGNKGFPSDWQLRWHVNGSSQVHWKEEWGPVRRLDDDHYTWSSFLTVDEENWKKISSVTCRAILGSLAPVSVTLKIN
ncbi:immunoglobulin lambda-1 light chain-like [Xiphophorus couchianus]|uniref:immunoglobulin lambda-1 light chain-like n=1 Tax=Xiphophorus couchianus TaxID=32473 RepID=UPI0010162E81|nr:immunoglobulin lambda-1 light chain-like [Xiphophorus couchianus]